MVWRTCYRLVGQEADAADCMQETFIAAWNFVRREEVQNWAGLLQRLATARGLDCLRHRRRRMRQMESGAELSEVAAGGRGPVQAAQSAELAERLRAVLAVLPRRQSQIHCLRHLNGFSYEQIAQEMGLSVSGVGVCLHRATNRLRKLLDAGLVEQTGTEPKQR
jgi:RNA polymerase sigma-70 factor (ECF subfamily)